MNGKGSKQRPTNMQVYNDNYSSINWSNDKIKHTPPVLTEEQMQELLNEVKSVNKKRADPKTSS
ncbi:hypothetical protein OAU81_00875 [bacterium]|nr:hypothetical protein [bacterium]